MNEGHSHSRAGDAGYSGADVYRGSLDVPKYIPACGCCENDNNGQIKSKRHRFH
jgi:hypothetical protein